MIGLFDSGHGGLTIARTLAERMRHLTFVYLGDHRNAPYGERPSQEVVALTRAGVETLFEQGCRLVILACNTATAVACRTLQRDWLAKGAWPGRNVLGIVAPTVEAATQTPWAVTEPQYPQKYRTDIIAVLATTRTVESAVYPEEISKRCPRARVVQQACPELAGLIEAGAPEAVLDEVVGAHVAALLERLDGRAPDWAILGCTHYPLVAHLFRRHLPPATRLLSQPDAVADSLEDYLHRHPHYAAAGGEAAGEVRLLSTGAAPPSVGPILSAFWGGPLAFASVDTVSATGVQDKRRAN